jgi:hypothetical protein
MPSRGKAGTAAEEMIGTRLPRRINGARSEESKNAFVAGPRQHGDLEQAVIDTSRQHSPSPTALPSVALGQRS